MTYSDLACYQTDSPKSRHNALYIAEIRILARTGQQTHKKIVSELRNSIASGAPYARLIRLPVFTTTRFVIGVDVTPLSRFKLTKLLQEVLLSD
jgi:hypothetical protein